MNFWGFLYPLHVLLFSPSFTIPSYNANTSMNPTASLFLLYLPSPFQIRLPVSSRPPSLLSPRSLYPLKATTLYSPFTLLSILPRHILTTLLLLSLVFLLLLLFFFLPVPASVSALVTVFICLRPCHCLYLSPPLSLSLSVSALVTVFICLRHCHCLYLSPPLSLSLSVSAIVSLSVSALVTVFICLRPCHCLCMSFCSRPFSLFYQYFSSTKCPNHYALNAD